MGRSRLALSQDDADMDSQREVDWCMKGKLGFTGASVKALQVQSFYLVGTTADGS